MIKKNLEKKTISSKKKNSRIYLLDTTGNSNGFRFILWLDETKQNKKTQG